MRIINPLPKSATTGLLAVGCAASLLVGCSSDDDPEEGATATATVTDTVTQPPASTPASEETPTAGAGQEPGQGADSCTEQSAVNPLTGDQPIPVHFANSDTSDVSFYYSAMEGAPDPCTPLSWVKLAGTNGTSGPGATSGSVRETVALFSNGQLITDPAPILARHIDSVEQIDDSTVRINYKFYTDAPAASGEFESGSATFHWDGYQLEVTENTLPTEQNETAETLNLGAVM